MTRFGFGWSGVAVGLLNDHLRHCVTAAVRSSDGGDASLTEVAGAIRQVLRL
jgi:DNA-binding FrmR family transcriptional regulator